MHINFWKLVSHWLCECHWTNGNWVMGACRYSETSDINGYQNEGLGLMDATIADGYRWSAATAYLWPALERPNLTLHTGQHTTRILFEDGRAVGVETQAGRGEPTVVHRARKEVCFPLLSGRMAAVCMCVMGNREMLTRPTRHPSTCSR